MDLAVNNQQYLMCHKTKPNYFPLIGWQTKAKDSNLPDYLVNPSLSLSNWMGRGTDSLSSKMFVSMKEKNALFSTIQNQFAESFSFDDHN